MDRPRRCCTCTRCWTCTRCCLLAGIAEGSVVFTRWRQCAPHLLYVSLGPHECPPNRISIGSDHPWPPRACCSILCLQASKSTRESNALYNPLSHDNFILQAVKVIWHKAASLPHTDGLIVFARCRQCATHLVVHFNQHRHRTGAAPCWVALCISTAGHVRTCRPTGTALFTRPALFALKIAPLHAEIWNPIHLTHGSVGPPSQHPERHHDRFSRYCRTHLALVLRCSLKIMFKSIKTTLRQCANVHLILLFKVVSVDVEPYKITNNFSVFQLSHVRTLAGTTSTITATFRLRPLEQSA